MKWKLLCTILSIGLLSSVCNLSWAGEDEMKHFTGGIALTEIGYGIGGLFWDESSGEDAPDFLSIGDWTPKHIKDYDADHWRKCVMGVGLTIAVGTATKQENSDMAWMFAGSFADIVLKSAWRAWIHRK